MITITTCRAGIACGLLALALARPAVGQSDPALDRGRRLTGWLLEGNADSLHARMSPTFRTQIGGVEGLRKFLDQVARLGDETGEPQEVVYQEAGLVSYYRIGSFQTLPGGTIHWIWDSAGTVQGMLVRPTPQPAPSEVADRETRTTLRLPFDGQAYVAWGGRQAHQNYHVESADQRFAYDFFLLDQGRIRRGSGTRNEDYACFGRPILAPAAGTVKAAVDSVPDNAPQRMNPRVPPGNHVIIDHGRGEFSVLAHLQRGSVRVRPGDRLDAGTPVGMCGNSGNSSAPHLHYHLQTRPRAGEGVGLPARFHRYRANGREVPTGEPVRGQTVQSADH
jgi:murein DD-endopeptidase MepM/ murein hydrolase activator NlpD